APPVARFVEADRESRFRDRMVGPVAGIYVAIEILLSLVVGFVLARLPGRRNLRSALNFIGLWLLAVVPLTFFGAVLDLDTVGPYLALVIGGGVLLAAAALTLRGTMRPLVALLGLLVTMHVVDVVTGGHLQINTVFGYSPTVGGRFAGFGNLTYGQVAAAAVLLAGLLASVPAFALVVLGLSGIRISWRRVAELAAAAAAAVLALGLLDLLRPAGERTHLGRLFEQIGHQGLRPF